MEMQKRRELHVWPSSDINGAIIELTEISIPEKIRQSVLNTRIWRKSQSFGIRTTDLPFYESSVLTTLECGLKKKAYFDYTQHY
jgi:hypothetical protein